jgi:hypothetical protein
MRKKYVIITLYLLSILLLIPSFIFAKSSVTVKWNANTETDLGSYRIYYGTVSRSYGSPMPVGLLTNYTIEGLEEGKTYYFSITAVDTAGNESGYSNEISKTIPAQTETDMFAFIKSGCLDNQNFIINGTPSPSLTGGIDDNSNSAIHFSNRQSLQFNYSDGLFDHSKGSMAFWFKPDSDLSSWGSDQYIFSNFGDGGRIRFQKDGRIEFRYATSVFTEPIDLKAGIWYHFIFRWWREGEDIRRVVIMNDTILLDDTISRDKPANSTTCYLFNRTADSTVGIIGTIDDFCISLDPAASYTVTAETPPETKETETSPITVYSKMESGKNEVGADLTINGSPSLSMGIDGKVSSAMQFANRQSFQFNYSDGLFDHSKGSMSFWFKPDSDLSSWGSDQYIFSNFGDGGRIRFQKDGRIEFRYATSVFTDSIDLKAGIWYHFIFRWWREGENIRRVVIMDDTILMDDTISRDKPSDPTTCYLFNRIADSTAGIIGTIDELYISSDPHADL